VEGGEEDKKGRMVEMAAARQGFCREWDCEKFCHVFHQNGGSGQNTMCAGVRFCGQD
jgi:hypothetical protein